MASGATQRERGSMQDQWEWLLMWKNLGDVVDRLQLSVAESRKRSDRRRSGECGGEGTGGRNILVSGRSLWHWALVGEKMDRLGICFGTGFGDAYGVATIIFAGTSDVPAANGVKVPSMTLGGGFKYQDLGAWGCE